jgi:hypothetical protein
MARHGTGAYDPYISRVAIIGDGGSSNRRLPGRRRCIARIWLSGGAEEICQASSSTRTAAVPGATTKALYRRLVDATGIQAARGRTSRAIASPLSMRALVRSCMACRFIQNSGLVP